jgi:plasmid stabilization system protein ParE
MSTSSGAGLPNMARRALRNGGSKRLLVALTKLEERPTRCRLAPEDGDIEDAEVRQFLFGRFRILFTVSGKQVLILHVRHGSRRYATQEELGQALKELGREEREGEA